MVPAAAVADPSQSFLVGTAGDDKYHFAAGDGNDDGLAISGWYRPNDAGAFVHQIERFQLSDGRTLHSGDVDKLIAAQPLGAAQTVQYWR